MNKYKVKMVMLSLEEDAENIPFDLLYDYPYMKNQDENEVLIKTQHLQQMLLDPEPLAAEQIRDFLEYIGDSDLIVITLPEDTSWEDFISNYYEDDDENTEESTEQEQLNIEFLERTQKEYKEAKLAKSQQALNILERLAD